MSFPFRINPITGGVSISSGISDPDSVRLQYIAEKWSIRGNINTPQNKIAESIAHILLTHPREHDTLPEFGSRLKEAVFEPNSQEFQLLFQFYLKHSTERWEKRAIVPDKNGVLWGKTPYLTDQGELPLYVDIAFITQQITGNLVAPFVNARQARSQEYNPVQFDNNGHDYYSRYYNAETFYDNNIKAIRIKAPGLVDVATDDDFILMKHTDSWLLMSWDSYGDIRSWDKISDMYLEDQAKNGASRDTMDILSTPPYGTSLRVPSRARILDELA
jgi:hypothetical protein